jgi:type II secretory pathway component GspD/PulD (secretin)
MSNVKRLSVVILLLGIALVVGANAQEAKPEEKEPALLLKSGMEDIPISELVQLFAEYSKQPVMYDPRTVTGTISILAPSEGHEPNIEETLLTALARYRLTLVKTGDYCEIVPMVEASTMCDSVTVDELKTLPAHRFARIVVQLAYTDANAARGALQNLLTRQGGSVSPVTGISNALILCDTAENLRRMLRTIAEIDVAPDRVSKVITLKHASADEVLGAIQGAAGKSVAMGLVESTNQIVLTAKSDEVERLAAVIAALDIERK